MKKIMYKNGDLVGVNGCVFINELQQKKHPCGRSSRIAVFECPICGNKFTSYINSVKIGATRSCGCLHYNAVVTANTKHGKSKHPVYFIWRAIISRCQNRKNHQYSNYGGRGISVYKKWLTDVDDFINYVESLPNYGKNRMTLDRIDNNRNYEPGNLRWATAHQQSINTRISKINKSGYIGVCGSYNNKFRAYITINYKQTIIGHFDSIIKAAIARDQYIIDNKLWEYPLQILTK